jgi:cytochrome b
MAWMEAQEIVAVCAVWEIVGRAASILSFPQVLSAIFRYLREILEILRQQRVAHLLTYSVNCSSLV